MLNFVILIDSITGFDDVQYTNERCLFIEMSDSGLDTLLQLLQTHLPFQPDENRIIVST